MKRTFVPILTALVPVLGLFSCSKDKPAEDSWRLSEPVIESSKGTSPVTVASTSRLPGDSELVFNAKEMKDASIRFDAKCESKLGTSAAKLNAMGADRIPLKSLWPQELWMRLDSDELKGSVCDFLITVFHGSTTHDFRMQGVRLESFLADGETQAKETYEVDGKNLSVETDLISALKIESSVEADLHLLCEHYSNSIKPYEVYRNRGELNVLTLLENLTEGKVSESDAIDSRYKFPIQTCRYLKTETKAGLLNYALSPSFVQKFRPPTLAVEINNGFRSANASTWRNQTVFSVVLYNQTAVATAIATPAHVGNMRLRLVGKVVEVKPGDRRGFPVGSLYLSSRLMSEPVTVTASSSARSWTTGGKTFYEVPAKSSITLTASINTGASCFGDVDLNPENLGRTRNMGVMHGFETPFNIEQLQSWDPENPTFGADLVSIDRGIANIGGVLLKGEPMSFSPSEAYYQTVDSLGTTPSIRQMNPAVAMVLPRKTDLCWYERLIPGALIMRNVTDF